MKKPKILLTGGHGYIGSSLRSKLARDFSLVSFDIRHNKRDDVRDFERLKKAVRGVDGVLHLAAISRPKWGYKEPYTCHMTNTVGTLNVLEAVRKVNPQAWVILGSSREVFGTARKYPVTEKSPRAPVNAYGVSKACGEDLLKQYAENYRLRCLTLRFSGVYTGRNDILDRVIPRFILQALRGVPITLEGNGKKKKFDFVYIDDVLDGIRRAIYFTARQHPGFYENITLTANSPVSLYDLARNIIRISGSRSKIVQHPERTYDVSGFWGSYKKAHELLGWKPKMVLKNGLERSIKELKNNLSR